MKQLKLLVALIGLSLASAIAANGPQAFASVGDAAAEGQLLPAGELSRSEVTLRGSASLMELAGSEANRLALQSLHSVMPIEQPQHRLPNGGLTSQPSEALRQALRGTPQSNAHVARQLAPNSTNASITGFGGLHSGDNVTANGYELEPPDQGLAVNNNVAVEIVNNVLRVFNAGSGAPLSPPIATTALYNLDPNVYNVSDPQVFFDPVSQRWFLTEVAYNATVNAFAIAVSQTSDPLGSYWVYLADAFSSKLGGCGSQDCFPDYPKDGYNADAFFITADLFNNASSSFVAAAIFAFPKAKLEAGASFTYLRFDDRNDFVLQPSVPAPGEPFSTARNGSEFLMSAPTASFGGPPRVSVLAVINTKSIVTNPSAVQVLAARVRTKGYGQGTVPSTEPNVVGPNCASVGATSAPLLDAGYPTFQATIQKANGNLYGALAEGTKDGALLQRDVIDWFVVHPSLTASGLSATIVNQGQIVPTNGYSISYPAFGLLKSGAGVLGFTITNVKASVAGGYPSAAVMQFSGSAPTGGIIVTGQGWTSDDGFTGCAGPGPGTVGRWGDYGAAVVDAATGYIYTANEMIPNPKVFARGTASNWGTFITQIH